MDFVSSQYRPPLVVGQLWSQDSGCSCRAYVSCCMGGGASREAQSRHSARLLLQSTELELPHAVSGRRVCLPPLGPGGDTLACGRGGPNSDNGTDTVAL
jgi:hypothetical protein